MAEDEDSVSSLDVDADAESDIGAQSGSDPEPEVDAAAWDFNEEDGEEKLPWRTKRKERLRAGPYDRAPKPTTRHSTQLTGRSGMRPSTSLPQFDARENSEAAFLVRLIDVPAEYSFATMLELHETRGLDTSSMKAALFSRGNWADGKLVSCEVVLTYSDAKSASAAVFALDGQKVTTSANKAIRLRAQLISAAREDSWHNNRAFAFGGKGSKVKGFKADGGEPPIGVLYPSVYVSDVPTEYTEKTLTDLQEACGMDATRIASMKFLPLTHPDAESRSVIVRYLDQDSADRAIDYLNGTSVQVSSGATKFIGAKPARPATWMFDKQSVNNIARARALRAP